MRSYTVADVFTDTPLQGNQVAVFLDAEGLGIETMQRAARELNLSETVFVLGELTGLEVVRLATEAGIVPIALTRRDGLIVEGEMEQPLPTWAPFDR
ncbi:MAG: PhzF family phenazine biosynthesis protein, partial [Solirubrobacteraceae bacterium]